MRRLAAAALSYSAAVYLAQYAIPTEWLVFCAVLPAALFICSLALKENRRVIAMLICAGAATGILWSFGHYKLTIEPARELAGRELSMTGRVASYPAENVSYSSVELILTSEGLPSVRMWLYSYGAHTELLDLEPGDIISANVLFRAAFPENERDSGANTSKGIFILGSLNGEIRREGKSKFSFFYFPLAISEAIKAEIARSFPSDTSHFMIALMTGDKRALREDYALDAAFGRAGLLHVVSVSGMHVAFLVGFIRLLTGRRRRTAAICIPLIVIFVTMTGGNPSTIRSGFLQIMLILAPLLRRENDSGTSLSLVLALLLVINPAAAKNVGLQLSFSSFAGIMLVTPRIHAAMSGAARGKEFMKNRFGRAAIGFIISGFSSTIGAIVFSTPISALHFGYVSIVAPITNVLTMAVVSFCFTSGFVICGIGLLLPAVGGALAWLSSWAVQYVKAVVFLLSAPPFAAVYTSHNLVAWWLIFAYAVISGAYFLRGKRKFRPIVPVCVSLWPLIAILLFTWSSASGRLGSVSALDVGQGQSIAIVSGSATVVIDCGGSEGDAGATMARYLLSQGRTRIDLLILTHLHSDHANGVESLIAQMRVDRLAFPFEGDDSQGLGKRILLAAADRNTEIYYVTQDTRYINGRMALWLYTPVGGKGDNERGLIIKGSIGEFDFLVTGDADSSAERRLLARTDLSQLELLVAGHHGSRYSSSEELLAAVGPEVAVISAGRNSYGHPTTEALERLDAAGAEIYRTDQCGTIEIMIG